MTGPGALEPLKKVWTVRVYRDDATTPVVYENVKHVFWIAGNTVLVIAQYTTSPQDGARHYEHWPRERFVRYRVDRAGDDLDTAISQMVAAAEANPDHDPDDDDPGGAVSQRELARACACGATTIDACVRGVDLDAGNDEARAALGEGCEAARHILTDRRSS